MKEDEVICPSQVMMGHSQPHKASGTGMDLSSPLEAPTEVTPVPYTEKQLAAHKQFTPMPQFKELEDECISLRDHNLKLNQQLIDSQRRERLMVRRLAAKEQELLDYVNQVAELKSVQTPAQAALKTAVLDPAVNVLFQKLKQELQSTQARLEETQNELAAWKFTPDSNTGKRLMAKCRLLHQENEELGKLTSNGRLAKLESELAMQKGISDDLKKSHCDLDEVLLELEEDVEGMQNTILLMQRELKVEKERNQSMERDNGKMLSVLRENPEWMAAERLRQQAKTTSVERIVNGSVEAEHSAECGGEERMDTNEMVLRTRSAPGAGSLKIVVEDHMPRGLRRTTEAGDSAEEVGDGGSMVVLKTTPATNGKQMDAGVTNNNNGQMVTRKRTRSAVANSVLASGGVGGGDEGASSSEDVLRPVDVEMAEEEGDCDAAVTLISGKRNRYSVVNSTSSASANNSSNKATSVGCVTRTRGQLQLESEAIKEVENCGGGVVVGVLEVATIKKEIGIGDISVDPLRMANKICSGPAYNNNNGSKLNIGEVVVAGSDENGRRSGCDPATDADKRSSGITVAPVPSGIEKVAMKLKLENGGGAVTTVAGAIDLRQEPSNV